MVLSEKWHHAIIPGLQTYIDKAPGFSRVLQGFWVFPDHWLPEVLKLYGKRLCMSVLVHFKWLVLKGLTMPYIYVQTFS